MIKTAVLAILLISVSLAGLETLSTFFEQWRYGVGKRTPLVASRKTPEISKKTSAVRIGFFGASTVVGVPFRELGFVSQFQTLLKEVYPESQFEVYRFQRNGIPSTIVLEKLLSTARYEWDALVVVTAHNEFLTNFAGKRARRLAELHKMLQFFAVTRLMGRLMKRLDLTTGSTFISGRTTSLFDRDSLRFKERTILFEENLDRIVAYAQKKEIPLFLGVPPSNIRNWAPANRLRRNDRLPKAYATTKRNIESLLLEKKWYKADVLLSQALKLYPQDSNFLYLKAKWFDGKARYQKALQWYTLAKDADPLPTRSLTQFNRKLRRFLGKKDVYIQDYEKLLMNQSKHGLLGFDFILDNVHPTPKANYQMAKLLLQDMGRVLPKLRRSTKGQLLSYESLMNKSDFKKKRHLVEIHIRSGIYALSNPFFNYEASRLHLHRALALDPNSWKAWVNLASANLLDGHFETGIENLKMAIRLSHRPIKLADGTINPYLLEALEKYYPDPNKATKHLAAQLVGDPQGRDERSRAPEFVD